MFLHPPVLFAASALTAMASVAVDQSFEHLQSVQEVILVEVMEPEVVEVPLLLRHIFNVEVSEPLLQLIANVGLLLLDDLLICSLGPVIFNGGDDGKPLTLVIPGMRM